jgi:hypothetical protein
LVEAAKRIRAPVPRAEADDQVYVLATDFDALVHPSTRKNTWGVGYLRRGTVLLGRTQATTRGCWGGQWAELLGGGWVCSKDGVKVLETTPELQQAALAPDLDASLPYRYAKVQGEGAPRFSRLPTLEEEQAIDKGKTVGGLAVTRTEGVHFSALESSVEREDVLFYRSLEGEYLRAEDLKMVEPPTMRGQPIAPADLPIAFVYGDSVDAFALEKDEPQKIGRVQKFARFAIEREKNVASADWVLAEEGFAIRRDAVRVARKVSRPKGVSQEDRWIHINLLEQTLVAYEGDTPVYVTLVSSGASGFDTPQGLHKIRRKYISKRMRGPDPDHGTYDIAEVPWTMYYDRGYALHGAYWHNGFGKTRSHGCTNVPPVDARWLFQWANPEVPPGWHAVHAAGSWVYLTGA